MLNSGPSTVTGDLFKFRCSSEHSGTNEGVQAMTTHVTPDRETLYHAIRDRYTEVALNPEHTFHFHHGRPLAEILSYPMDQVDALPAQAVESFSGVGNPFSLGPVHSGETLLDVGSGGGFDCFIAAQAVGPTGQVIGVDMTDALTGTRRSL